MARARREVLIAPKALEGMEAAKPTEAERDAIRAVLAELGTDTSRSYKIAFVTPPTYRIDVGRFRIHFRCDDHSVEVGFIGVY
jgi:hypothetical protein